MVSQFQNDSPDVQIIEVETRQLQIAFEAKDAFKFTQTLRFHKPQTGMDGRIFYRKFALPWVTQKEHTPFYSVYANWLPLLPQFYIESEKIRVQLHPNNDLVFTFVAWEYALSLCSSCIVAKDFKEHYQELRQSIPDGILNNIAKH